MSKIYIAGCGGMLGEAFHQQFSSTHELKCTDIDDNEPWLSPLDFRDLGAYRKDIEAFKPDALFHLGAHTSLEYCEEHADDAYATNTMAVENAVFIANRLEIPLLYISTVPAQQSIVTVAGLETLTFAPARDQRVIPGNVIEMLKFAAPALKAIIIGATEKALIIASTRDQRVIPRFAKEVLTVAIALQAIGIGAAIEVLTVANARDQRVIPGFA
jgi:hypothetical protein